MKNSRLYTYATTVLIVEAKPTQNNPKYNPYFDGMNSMHAVPITWKLKNPVNNGLRPNTSAIRGNIIELIVYPIKIEVPIIPISSLDAQCKLKSTMKLLIVCLEL